jgi:recombinational DNA repair protein RecR
MENPSFVGAYLSRFRASCVKKIEALIKPLTLQITFCGTCMNYERYNQLRMEIYQHFNKQQINIVEPIVETVCLEHLSSFEVEIIHFPRMLHSKKAGDGFVDTNEKLELIVKRINDALERSY